MAVEALGKNHLRMLGIKLKSFRLTEHAPAQGTRTRDNYEPACAWRKKTQGRTIFTRAVALLQYFSYACLGAWSYFITPIFIYHACPNCILYLYILQQIALILLRSSPAYVYELSLAFVVNIFKAQSDVKLPTIVHPLTPIKYERMVMHSSGAPGIYLMTHFSFKIVKKKNHLRRVEWSGVEWSRDIKEG